MNKPEIQPSKGAGWEIQNTPPTPMGGVIRNKCINTKGVFLKGETLQGFMIIKSDHAGQLRTLLLVTQGSCSASKVLTTAALALEGMASANVRQENLFTASRQGPKTGPVF